MERTATVQTLWARSPPSAAQTPHSAGADTAQDGGKARAKSTCFINRAATPLKNVRKVGNALVDVNAQNSSLSLRAPSTQLALLDMIAGTAGLARSFATRLAELRAARRRLEELRCAPPAWASLTLEVAGGSRAHALPRAGSSVGLVAEAPLDGPFQAAEQLQLRSSDCAHRGDAV
jgi:hypothetical protein